MWTSFATAVDMHLDSHPEFGSEGVRSWRVGEWLAASLEMKCRVTGCGFESRALRLVTLRLQGFFVRSGTPGPFSSPSLPLGSIKAFWKGDPFGQALQPKPPRRGAIGGLPSIFARFAIQIRPQSIFFE